jgi:hypothetical protein
MSGMDLDPVKARFFGPASGLPECANNISDLLLTDHLAGGFGKPFYL